VYADVVADAAAESCEHVFHRVAVAFPYLVGADVFLKRLQRPEEPERSIDRIVGAAHVRE
jgi:hypothetical protein